MNAAMFYSEHKEELAAIQKYEPFKVPYGSAWEWKVKTLHGIVTFKTKAAATEYADKAKDCNA